MADNVNVTPGTGNVVAADEVVDGTLGTVKVQFVKLMDGTLDGTGKAAVGASGLKVDPSGVTSPVLANVSGATVAIGGTVTVAQSTAANLKVDLSGTGANATAIKVDPSGVTSPVLANISGATIAVGGTVAATQSGTWTVQPGNTANTTAWKVDGSAVTQPVSGTVTASQTTASSLKAQVQPSLSALPTVGQTTSNTTQVQLGSGAATQGVLVQALSTNAASVFVGASGVSLNSGFELQPGQAVPFSITNSNTLYVTGSNGTDKVCWNVL